LLSLFTPVVVLNQKGYIQNDNVIFLNRSSTRRCLQTGIVGLPNVGKSTLFNAMMGAPAAAAENFPFCTIEPNHGTVALYDEKLEKLAEIHDSVKVVPTSLEFVDIAGIIKGASEGLGLGNKFLSHIRECDALIEVVRCFEDDDIIHVENSIDPLRDIDVIDTELALADLSMVENALAKTKTKSDDVVVTLKKALELLGEGIWLSSADWTDSEIKILDIYPLLTRKPVIYAANVGEDDLSTGNAMVDTVREYAESRGSEVIVVSAHTESELSQLSQEDKNEYLEALDVDANMVGMRPLVKAAYKELGLITFYTSGETESRAWTTAAGSTAPQAAGKIHTDFEKGFIRAETTAYDDLIKHNGPSGAKAAGRVRSEGKAYIVNDGDVMLFRFKN